MDETVAPYDDETDAFFANRRGWRSASSENRTDLYFDQWTWTSTETFPWDSPTVVQCLGGGSYQVIWAVLHFVPVSRTHFFEHRRDLLRAVEAIERWEGLVGDEPPKL